jgi:hypothetical protein
MSTQSLIRGITGERLPSIIYEDNLGSIYLVKNEQVSARTNHIDVRDHYLWDLHEDGQLEVSFKRSEENSADIITKNTPRSIHEKHTAMIRSGTLTCWRDNVKNDPSVTLHGMPDANWLHPVKSIWGNIQDWWIGVSRITRFNLWIGSTILELDVSIRNVLIDESWWGTPMKPCGWINLCNHPYGRERWIDCCNYIFTDVNLQ